MGKIEMDNVRKLEKIARSIVDLAEGNIILSLGYCEVIKSSLNLLMTRDAIRMVVDA